LIYVVGSGPAGVACAHALVQRGKRVTMLDAGVEMDPELQQVLASFKDRAPAEWSRTSLERIRRRPIEASNRTVPLKASYGSLFPYQDVARHLAVETRGVDALPSFAKGGFSNVWGGTVLPYRAHDIAEWPITVGDLAPHYAAAARLLGVEGVHGRLDTDFPFFADESPALRPSRQAEALMRDLDANADELDRSGWLFGYSRLAVAANSCVYCGLCMYGCPHGLIYNSSTTLAALRRHETFAYRPDVVVTHIVESAGGVRVHAAERSTGERLTFDGDRVCLAAGTFPTTAILLASLDAYDTPVTILDSQIFLLPLLRYHGVPHVREESLYTLSQIFGELLDPTLSTRTMHLQVYAYNDWLLTALQSKLGPLYPLVKPFLDPLLGRLLVVQGYLHSELSPPIRATLQRGASGRGDTLVLQALDNAAAMPAIKGVVRALGRHRRHLRALAVSPLLEICAPGRGYHSGGSFPMAREPQAFESDRWGRPSGFERVHAVDATVFPSVPAGPITFTVVANAHRIGSALD